MPSASYARQRPLSTPFAHCSESGNGKYEPKAGAGWRVGQKVKKWWRSSRRTGGLVLRPGGLFRPRRILLGLVLLGVVLFLIFRRRSTLVLSKADVAKVWRWEVASGRYPSRRRPSWSVKEYPRAVRNPGLPAWDGHEHEAQGGIRGVGPPRQYLRVPRRQPHDASVSRRPPSPFPPRPVPNSAIDFDVVMDNCDFSQDRYVRDCLSVLRSSAGMDDRTRVAKRDSRLTFLPSSSYDVPGGVPTDHERAILDLATRQTSDLFKFNETILSALLSIRHRLELSSPVSFPTDPPTPRHPTHPTADAACDPAHPRIFHVYWSGVFTDKPYVAALSFLYTQRLSLSRPLHAFPEEDEEEGVCRPQLWFWINPGPASSVPDAQAERKMYETLVGNQWSAPLLHSRFRDAIKFRLWNSTEQLNAIPELKGWDSMGFFKSGGVKYKQHKAAKSSKVSPDLKKRQDPTSATAPTSRPSDVGEDELSRFGEPAKVADEPLVEPSGSPAPTRLSPEEELFNRVGSAAESDYDRLSVILSDMARFVLTYRFGGIYLDADTIFLRDWEEVWGWHGAFAYRWSRLPLYNTAVLKMARGSALGSFIFRTAVRNGLDFHPMVVSRYLKDAGMEELLLRLPDALFDPAWLNIENYQRDRPAFPVFQAFKDFFLPPVEHNAAPAALGLGGFFRGAFSYHYHNFWWLPFDPSRDFPDLGARFLQRGQPPAPTAPEGDLSWATVLKRTFEKYLRGQAPDMYGSYINFDED